MTASAAMGTVTLNLVVLRSPDIARAVAFTRGSVCSSHTIDMALDLNTSPPSFRVACSSFIHLLPMAHPRLALASAFEFRRLTLHSRPWAITLPLS
jgi:hypothetical protein